VKAILGRLSELGLRELFKLLTSAGTEGVLDLDGPSGPARLLFRDGQVSAEISTALLAAYATRSGTYCFRPGPVEDGASWESEEDFLAHLEADAGTTQRVTPPAAWARPARAGGAADPLAELRDSLEQIPIAGGGVRVLVVAADPRPYRALEPEWKQRGWEVVQSDTPKWPEGPAPSVLVIHVPATSSQAEQGEGWLDLVKRASTARPRVPAVWVGGLADPWLRHQVILAGADFMVPAPVSEVGETARWFREEITLLVDRLLARRGSGGEGDAEAFRDFFLALHVDASPSEVRASLLRFAGTFFARGVLFGLKDTFFESVGGYGFFLPSPVRVWRGVAPLEGVVVERRPMRLTRYTDEDVAAIVKALKPRGGLDHAEVFPILAGGECLAIFLGDQPIPEAGGPVALAAVLARSGTLLGLV
jgi:hypothetical protein